MRGVARALVRYRAAVLGLAALVTLLLGTRAAHVRVEGGLENLLPAGDPEVAYYAEVRKVFGSDDVGVVGVRADDVLAPATLAKIAQVTDALAHIEGVEHVLSLTNAVDPAADVFAPPRLLPHIPPSPEEIAALRQKLATTPLYRRNLVAEDFRGAAINVFFKPLTDAEYADLGIDARIAAVLAAAGGPERFYYTGAAHVKQAARPRALHALGARRHRARARALVPHQARRPPPAPRRPRGAPLDARHPRARRPRDHDRHVRPAAAPPRGRQLLRHPRDGALLRAGRCRRRADGARRARLRARGAAAHHLGADYGHRLRRAHGQSHSRDLGARVLRGRGRALPARHLPARPSRGAREPAGGAARAARRAPGGGALARGARAGRLRLAPRGLHDRRRRRLPRAPRGVAHPRRRRLPPGLQPSLRGAPGQRDHQPRDRRQQSVLYHGRGRGARPPPALGGPQGDPRPRALRRDPARHHLVDFAGGLPGAARKWARPRRRGRSRGRRPGPPRPRAHAAELLGRSPRPRTAARHGEREPGHVPCR